MGHPATRPTLSQGQQLKGYRYGWIFNGIYLYPLVRKRGRFMPEAELFKAAGKIAGLAGIALCVVLLIYRPVINAGQKIQPSDQYKLLRLITICVWLLAVLCIVIGKVVSHSRFGAS